MNNSTSIEFKSEALLEVEETRQRVDHALQSINRPLLSIIGPCAAREVDSRVIKEEGNDIAQVASAVKDITALHRLPIWKPRTRKEDWHGEETTNAIGALHIIEQQSQLHAATAIELGLQQHLGNYAHLLSFGWIGARSEDDIDLKLTAASFDRSLPLGVKNGIDGSIDKTLSSIDRMRAERDTADAKIVLIFRGGEKATNPDQWERDYLDALNVTNGQLIVDVAHGSEMAHDPTGDFQKTVLGQIACMDHVIQLAGNGAIPAGIMIEASDVVSITDPAMPFQASIQGVIELKNNIQPVK